MSKKSHFGALQIGYNFTLTKWIPTLTQTDKKFNAKLIIGFVYYDKLNIIKCKKSRYQGYYSNSHMPWSIEKYAHIVVV